MPGSGPTASKLSARACDVTSTPLTRHSRFIVQERSSGVRCEVSFLGSPLSTSCLTCRNCQSSESRYIPVAVEASGAPQIDRKPNSTAEFLVTFLNAWLFQGTVVALEDLVCPCMHLTECRRVLLTEWKIRTCPPLVCLRCSSENWLAHAYLPSCHAYPCDLPLPMATLE